MLEIEENDIHYRHISTPFWSQSFTSFHTFKSTISCFFITSPPLISEDGNSLRITIATLFKVKMKIENYLY